MTRLCLRCMAGCAIAVVSFGCSGQNVEGSWLGKMPFDDSLEYRIRLYSNHRFDITSRGKERLGTGSYRFSGKDLEMSFSAYVWKGVPERTMPNLKFQVEGLGNHLILTEPQDRTRTFQWYRQRL